MLISRTQISQFDHLVFEAFVKDLHDELSEDDVINSQRWISVEQLQTLINDALGAGINTETLVYAYCDLTITNQVLLSRPFPAWAKNILFTDAESADKIQALRTFLE